MSFCTLFIKDKKVLQEIAPILYTPLRRCAENQNNATIRQIALHIIGMMVDVDRNLITSLANDYMDSAIWVYFSSLLVILKTYLQWIIVLWWYFLSNQGFRILVGAVPTYYSRNVIIPFPLRFSRLFTENKSTRLWPIFGANRLKTPGNELITIPFLHLTTSTVSSSDKLSTMFLNAQKARFVAISVWFDNQACDSHWTRPLTIPFLTRKLDYLPLKNACWEN